MAQLVERPSLDFGSGHDLTVMGLALHGAPCSAGSLLGILSLLSLQPHPREHVRMLTRSLSLK